METFHKCFILVNDKSKKKAQIDWIIFSLFFNIKKYNIFICRHLEYVLLPSNGLSTFFYFLYQGIPAFFIIMGFLTKKCYIYYNLDLDTRVIVTASNRQIHKFKLQQLLITLHLLMICLVFQPTCLATIRKRHFTEFSVKSISALFIPLPTIR